MAAFAFTITKQTIQGDRKVVYGTFTPTAGSTGGDITTGLGVCEFIELQHTGGEVVTDMPVADETFPVVGGVVTIVTVADKAGLFKALGY
jgi:hypothetical protein